MFNYMLMLSQILPYVETFNAENTWIIYDADYIHQDIRHKCQFLSKAIKCQKHHCVKRDCMFQVFVFV